MTLGAFEGTEENGVQFSSPEADYAEYIIKANVWCDILCAMCRLSFNNHSTIFCCCTMSGEEAQHYFDAADSIA